MELFILWLLFGFVLLLLIWGMYLKQELVSCRREIDRLVNEREVLLWRERANAAPKGRRALVVIKGGAE